MPEPRNPRNIPVRENLVAGGPPIAAQPGDANPDLARSAVPGGPTPQPHGTRRKHTAPSEAATADIEEPQGAKGVDDDPGRPPDDAPPYR